MKVFTRLKKLYFRRVIVCVHDLLVIGIAWYGAFWLRFNLELIPNEILQTTHQTFPYVLTAQALAFWSMGLYRGLWRFASMPDLIRIFKAVFLGIVLTLLGLFFFTLLHQIPRSVILMDGLLLIVFLGGDRFAIRTFKHYVKNISFSGKRTLVIGAGKGGESLVRDLIRSSNLNYKPVCFVDDNTQYKGREIHGIRVLGTSRDIPELVEKYSLERAIIAIPSASAKSIRRIVSICQKIKLPVVTLPALNALSSPNVGAKDLREIAIEDLLGREPVTIDCQAIQHKLTDRCVLITGAGGSIGSELCRQIAKFKPSVLVLVDHSEFNLFSIEQELNKTHPDLTLSPRLISICDEPAIQEVFKNHQPDIVFHAAAYKHVPLLQNQIREAVYNNVIGTRNVAQAAVDYKAKTFVLVSTDKAVNPTNTMGKTKRLTEILCNEYNQKFETNFITVRFGNVLDSAGSVVPIFRKQIAEGGPVTVTHPDIERFFMTIPEAAQLILQAAVMGMGGEIFVLDMGEPIKIKHLAEQMIRLSGKKPYEDIDVVFTGLRPGEKMYEELFYSGEELAPTRHKKLLIARTNFPQSLNSVMYVIHTACINYREKTLHEILADCLFSITCCTPGG